VFGFSGVGCETRVTEELAVIVVVVVVVTLTVVIEVMYNDWARVDMLSGRS
jgi:hypothetical protein